MLVVGAGPAGSACARVLAQAGRRVTMVDAQVFPRDKTCGDGLVPDTHAALRRLGVLDAVLERARRVPHAECVAPGGQAIEVPGELAVLPRRELDALLCDAAIAAGASFIAPARFERLSRDASGRVVGAELAGGRPGSGDALSRSIRARWTVLATGAAVGSLLATGVCTRREPSAMALRMYVRHPALAREPGGLRFVWHARLKGGYGWVFPGPDETFNIGVGLLDGRTPAGGRSVSQRNLRTLFDDFLRIDPVAARLMREGQSLGPPKGAPLRCDLEGAEWCAPGLMVVGDAVGATYSFTGEGIGKAMETGICAAECLVEALQRQPADDPPADAQALSRYRAELQARLPRFQLYRRAASFNRHPWLIRLVIWRARRSARIIARLGDILNERRMPGSLLSWRGLKALIAG